MDKTAHEMEIERLREDVERCQCGPMKQKCIEKSLELIKDKLETRDREIKLMFENLVLTLKTEITNTANSIQASMAKAISEQIRRSNDDNQSKFKFGVEAVKFFITIVAFIIAIKLAKG